MVCVTTLSRNARSWLTSSSVPAYSCSSRLQQFQRFDVEIVGRLVQHEQVGRPARTGGPAAAGCARRPRAPCTGDCAGVAETGTRRDTYHVLAIAVDGRPVSIAGANRVDTVQLGVELLALLMEVGHLHVGPGRTVPSSGGGSPSSIRSIVVLPAPFGPMRPDPVCRMTRADRSANHLARAEPPCHVLRPRPPAGRPGASSCRRTLPGRSRRAVRSWCGAPSGAARGPRSACGAPRPPCGSRPLPAPRTCRSGGWRLPPRRARRDGAPQRR